MSQSQAYRWWIDILGYASVGYLAFPVAIFLLGWTRPLVAMIALGTLVFAVWTSGKTIVNTLRLQLLDSTHTGVSSYNNRGLAAGVGRLVPLGITLLLLLPIVLLWGVGGYGPQDSDYPKHNAILKALIEDSWPTFVESDRGAFPLVFYVAYYLPGALVGKLWGWVIAHHFLQLWSVFGLLLAIGWFWLLVGRSSGAVPVVFFFFSGWDVVGAAIVRLWRSLNEWGVNWYAFDPAAIDWAALRWWNWQVRWWDLELARNYPNPIEQLFFVPHQSLAGWIVTGMVAAVGMRSPEKAITCVGLLCTLLALWSPLVVVGVLPLIGWLLAESWGQGKQPASLSYAVFSPANLASLPTFMILILYYASRFGPLPFASAEETSFGIGHLEWAWSLFLPRYLLFVILEVGIIAALIAWMKPFDTPGETRCFLICLLWLGILPLFRYGACNDLVMRASLPGLFLLAVWFARALAKTEVSSLRKFILVGCLTIGATAPFSDLYAHFREAIRRGQLVDIPREDEVWSLWELNQWSAKHAATTTHPLVRMFRDQTFFVQYVGSGDTVFFRFFARSCNRNGPSRGP